MSEKPTAFEEYVSERVRVVMAKMQAEWEASRRPVPPTPEEQLQAKLAEARFFEQVSRAAMAAGADPRYVRYVVRDAEEVFELKDGALVAKNGATDPNDPLTPLSPTRWLQDYARSDFGSRFFWSTA